MKIRGILFDLDGTLIDTIDLIIQAFEHSFAVCLNKKMPRAELVKYFGLPLRSAMENYVDKNQVETLCAVYREFNLKYHDELIKPFPGVKETLSVLQQRGIKNGCCYFQKGTNGQTRFAVYGVGNLYRSGYWM